MKIDKRIEKCRNRTLKSFNPWFAYIYHVFSPFAVFTNFRTFWVIIKEFFFLQYFEKLHIFKIPVVHVDHPLDEKIPFTPQKVSIYLDFINLWVRPLTMLGQRLGLVRGPKVCKRWMRLFRKLYVCAGQIYHFRLTTTNRPKYKEMREFRQIHALDPHFLCVPSLHIATVLLAFAFYRQAFKDEDFTEDEISRWQPELYVGAVEISETVLYVKQHSVNCIPAAIYMVLSNFPELISEDEGRKFVDDLFLNPEGFSLDEAKEIKEYIKNRLNAYIAEGKTVQHWYEPVHKWLVDYDNQNKAKSESKGE